MQKAYSHLSYKPGSLPVTEAVAGRILSLPIYPGLSDSQVEIVIAAVKSFFTQPGQPATIFATGRPAAQTSGEANDYLANAAERVRSGTSDVGASRAITE